MKSIYGELQVGKRSHGGQKKPRGGGGGEGVTSYIWHSMDVRAE